MSPEKPDFPPLLAGGIHRYDLSDLRMLTVDRFSESARRKPLFDCFTVYLDLLKEAGLTAEIWVDGSFMSEKVEPDDIDMVVVYDDANVRSLPAHARQMLTVLLDKNLASARFGLHVHSVRHTQESDVIYWRTLFGTMRDEKTPKGIASLRVSP